MFVITGATGTVGRPLVEALLAQGAAVRAVSRDPGAAGLPAGADLVEGDPARPATIAPLLEGATGLFLHSRAAASTAAELVALAADHGVRRVVALAASNVDDDLDHQPSRYRGDRNKETEDAVVNSGLEWVSLRPGTFADNALTAWGAQIRAGDVVRGVYARFAEPPLHERDLAEVAARALLTDELVGRKPELTGPESLTHEEMVAIIGTAIGRTLRYQEVPPEAAAQGMVRAGLPAPFVEALMARYTRQLGRPAAVTGEVEKILGRPARTFAEWAADRAAAFAG
jgi:uncharacterized protein YbjT (DUF2867 family)